MRQWIFAEKPPSVTRVYFIRHAQSDHSVKEDVLRPLTPKGFADAEKLSGLLGGIGFDRIYSSPYPRAIQTITPLACRVGLAPILLDGFREYSNGDGKGWIKDWDALSRRLWNDFSYVEAGCESFGQVQARNLPALAQVLAAEPERTVAIGTHGVALAVMLKHHLPSFTFEDFDRLVPLLPYVIRLDFLGGACVDSQEILFDL